jgi:hypothetical protein
MAGRSVPVVLIPRWTSYIGAGTFPTAPIPVAAYSKLVLDFMGGTLPGGVGTASFVCRESNDLATWSVCGGSTPTFPGPFSETQWQFDITMAWLRFDVQLVGAGAALTCYGQGYFELREK